MCCLLGVVVLVFVGVVCCLLCGVVCCCLLFGACGEACIVWLLLFGVVVCPLQHDVCCGLFAIAVFFCSGCLLLMCVVCSLLFVP